MKYLKHLIFIIAYTFLIVSVQSQTVDLTRYVNPFIGTGDGLPERNSMDNAYTNPGPVLPWGMMSRSEEHTSEL